MKMFIDTDIFLIGVVTGCSSIVKQLSCLPYTSAWLTEGPRFKSQMNHMPSLWAPLWDK